MMTTSEFKKALKIAKNVLGAVRIVHGGDPQYIKLIKSDVLSMIAQYPNEPNVKWDARLRDDGCLYIN